MANILKSTRSIPFMLVALGLGIYAVHHFLSSDHGDVPTLAVLKQKLEMNEIPSGERSIKPAGKENTAVAKDLADVQCASNYSPMKERSVQFAVNTWPGWAPVIYANDGFYPTKEWYVPSTKSFKVNIRSMDDPLAMRDAFAAGEIHIASASADTLPLFVEASAGDACAMPRVLQQIDWSNGGDLLLSRDRIEKIEDLRGNSVILVQGSRSLVFLVKNLVDAGVHPSTVDIQYATSMSAAVRAFEEDETLSAIAGWVPILDPLQTDEGIRELASTAQDPRLVGDVWFARADFARDHPDVVAGIVRNVFRAMNDLQGRGERARVSTWIAANASTAVVDAQRALEKVTWTDATANAKSLSPVDGGDWFDWAFDVGRVVHGAFGSLHDEVAPEAIVDPSEVLKLTKKKTPGLPKASERPFSSSARPDFSE